MTIEQRTKPVPWYRLILLFVFLGVGTVASDRFLRPTIGDFLATACLYTVFYWLLIGFVLPVSLSAENATIRMTSNVRVAMLGILGIVMGGATAAALLMLHSR